MQRAALPWKIYRDGRGWPRWWQRWYEAWLVLSGRYSFFHAFDDGKHCGAAGEYQRIVINGGDLVPLIDAAIYATAVEILEGQEPQAGTLEAIRPKVWQRYTHQRALRGTLGRVA